VHVALPDRLPREQESAPVPDIVYPLLHVGAHALPLARLDVQVPSAPFAGAVTAHGLAVHPAVSVNVPAAHDRLPVIVYPLLHVGVHVLPLARLDVHVPAAPLVGASDASHEEATTTRHSSRNSPSAKRELSDDAAETQCGDWSWFVLT
jgi:hypothetical protein